MRQRGPTGWTCAAAIVASLAFASTASATPRTFRANKLGDHAPGACTQGDCTLREAVRAANGHPGRDTVLLRPGAHYELRRPGAGEDVAKTGDLDVTDPTGIRAGKGRPARVDANGIDRVFDVSANTTIRLIIIRGGRTVGPGGGIRTSPGAKLTLTRSTVTANRSDGDGGGIYADSTPLLTVENSTISANRSASQGGGVGFFAGAGTFVNTTIAANRAEGYGGGIHIAFASNVSLSAATVVRNVANFGGHGAGAGGGFYGSPVRLDNSIVALNRRPGTTSSANCGDIDSGGHNLFSSVDGCNGLDGPGDLVRAHPKLGKLRSNGGPTKTIALLKGSPAINKAGADAPTHDQRGRMHRGRRDVGAFERGGRR